MNIPEKQTKSRIQTGTKRGREINVTVNGIPVLAYEGESIGSMLMSAGMLKIRHAFPLKDPRGLYCCVGSCFGCLVTVDGQPNIRACVTPVRANQKIVLQEGLGEIDPNSLEPFSGHLVRRKQPLVVLGGGSAGISAAIAAARIGVSVLIIDENSQAGGQIYRQLPEEFSVENLSAFGKDYIDGNSLLEKMAHLSDRITVWTNSLVWGVFEGNQLAIEHGHDLVLIDADAIIVATGAYERPVPVPGWTLPGVMTAGGAQVLIKSQRVRPGQKVLLAGTGPLQLVVANQMLDVGIKVVAIAESACFQDTWKLFPSLLRKPGLVKQGLAYLYDIRRAGTQMLRSHVIHQIEGDGQVERVVLRKVDSEFRPVTGSEKTFDVDTVCIGYGLIPSIELTRMFGCRHIYNPLVGGWIPYFDKDMQTSKSGIFVAGDGAGIAGVLVARMEGTLAGLYAAVYTGFISKDQAEKKSNPVRQKLASMISFRRAMDQIYRISPNLYANVSDETIVCRCEGVTAGMIRKAIIEGTMNPNDIKKRTRSGMGYCQGRHCMPTIAAILVREFGANPSEIAPMTIRPPVRPVPLHLLTVDL